MTRAALLALLLATPAAAAEHDTYAFPCPPGTLTCHQVIVDQPPGGPAMMLRWVGANFEWVPVCGAVDAAGRIVRVGECGR